METNNNLVHEVETRKTLFILNKCGKRVPDKCLKSKLNLNNSNMSCRAIVSISKESIGDIPNHKFQDESTYLRSKQ